MAAKKNGVDLRLDEIARVRARLLTLDREVDECQRAPLPRAECEARIDAAMTRATASLNLDRLGQLLISPARKGSIDLASGIAELLAGDPATKAGAMPAGAVLAAVVPDELKAWLLGVANDAAEAHPPAISAEERQQRLDLLASERTDLERAEAEALWIIEDHGVPAPWRGDQDAALVLGLDP